MLTVRRTVETDYTQLKWRAEMRLEGTLAARVVEPSGPKDAPRVEVCAFGNTPEHAINECYLSIGKRAALMQEPAAQ